MADTISFEDAMAAPGDGAAAKPDGHITFEEMYGAPPPPPAASGLGTYAKEALKGGAQGAIDTGAGILRGAGDLGDMAVRRLSPTPMPETEASPLRAGSILTGTPDQAAPSGPNLGVNDAIARLQQSADQALAPAPGWEESTTRKVAETTGGLLPYAAASLVPGGNAAAIVAGGLQGADTLQQKAAQMGAGQNATDAAMLGGGAVGTLIGMIPGAGVVLGKFAPEVQSALLGYAIRTAAAGAAGGGIGAVASALDDAVEKYTVNPDKVVGEGMLGAAGLTAAAAAILHGTLAEAHRAATHVPEPSLDLPADDPRAIDAAARQGFTPSQNPERPEPPRPQDAPQPEAPQPPLESTPGRVIRPVQLRPLEAGRRPPAETIAPDAPKRPFVINKDGDLEFPPEEGQGKAPDGVESPEAARGPETPEAAPEAPAEPVKETTPPAPDFLTSPETPEVKKAPGDNGVPAFDPREHLNRIADIANKTKLSLSNPAALGKKLDLAPDQVTRLLQHAAMQPEKSGIMQLASGKFQRTPKFNGPIDIVQFLGMRGGVQDQGGDIGKDHGRTLTVGGTLVRKGGMPLDEARRAAQDAGYLPPDPVDAPATSDINDLLDAIHSTVSDKTKRAFPIYGKDSRFAGNEAEDKTAADRNRHDMERAADELGVPHEGVPDDKLAEALHTAKVKESNRFIEGAHGDAYEDDLGNREGPRPGVDEEIPFDESPVRGRASGDDPPFGFEDHPAGDASQAGEGARDGRGASGELAEKPTVGSAESVHVLKAITEEFKDDPQDHSAQLADYLRAKLGDGPQTHRAINEALGAWTVGMGRTHGDVEYAAMYRANAGRVELARTDHDPSSVRWVLPRNVLDDPNSNLIFSHNHPNNSSQSGADIGNLAYRGLHSTIAYAHDGNFSLAKLTGKARSALDTLFPDNDSRKAFLGEKLWGDAWKKVLPVIKSDWRAGNLTDHDANTIAAEAVNLALAREGVLHHVSSFDLTKTPEQPTLRALRTAIFSVRSTLREKGIEPAGNGFVHDYRPPAPIRAEEAFDRVFGKDAQPAQGGQGAAGSQDGNQNGAGEPRGKLQQGVAEQSSVKDILDRERQYPSDIQDSLNRWNGKVDARPVYQKVKDAILAPNKGYFAKWLYMQTVDRRFNVNEKTALQAGLQNGRFAKGDVDDVGKMMAHVSAHYAASMGDRAAGFTEDNLHHGPTQFDGLGFKTAQRDAQGKPINGMLDILQPIGERGLWREWAAYERITRASRLSAEGRDQHYDPVRDQATKRFLEQQYPEFKGIHDEMQRSNRAMLKFLVDTGRLDQAKADEWAKHNDYSPFYRQMHNELLGTSGGTMRGGTRGPVHIDALTNDRTFRRLKGGDEQVGEYLGNMVRNLQAINAVGMKNVAALRYLRDAELTGVAQPARGNPIELEKDPNVVRVYRGGKAEYWRVDDTLTMKALQGLDGTPLNPFLKALGMPANLLRTLTTHSPIFLAFNHPVRESMQAWFTNKTFIPPVISAVKGHMEVLRNSAATQELRHHGISAGYDISGGGDNAMKAILHQYAKDAPGVTGLLRRAWDKYERLGESADLGVRTQIYQKELARLGGGAKAEYQATSVALRSAVNFKQRGAAEAMRWLTIMVPFLNARIQGLDTLGRAAVNRPGASLAKFMTLAGLSAAYYAYVNQNPLYQRAPDQLKDENWLVPLGNTLLRIPAPFELGILAKRVPERILRLMTGDDMPQDTRAAFSRALLDTLKFNPLPQAVLPAVEVATNHSFFTGNSIETRQMENLPEAQRYDHNTSETAKGAGAVTGFSPQMIDHLLKGYFGTIGGYALAATDAMVNAATGGHAEAGSPRTLTGLATMVTGGGSILKDNSNMGSEQVSRFYEMKRDVDQLVQGMKTLQQQGRGAEAAQTAKDNAGLLAVKGYAASVGKALTQINKAQNAVRASSSMPPEEKRTRLDDLDQQRQNLLKGLPAMRQRAYGG